VAGIIRSVKIKKEREIDTEERSSILGLINGLILLIGREGDGFIVVST